ncbi:hypothetical protein N665_0462s0028 [Sinapis alba]|nr:hypothetical protein N665_0462s0028 [Sinapis alba]
MRTKNKGKVHPSPSPLPPFSSPSDCLSVLKLLPAVILALVSALSPEDKQVLAYLITRSLKTTTTMNAGGRSSCDSTKNKKQRTPVFDCECFDCYMSYWFRWDSSPNRELIHQIIEAFEDHLTNGENSSAASKKSNGRGGGGKKKKDKSSRRPVEESPIASEITEPVEVPCDEVKSPEKSTEMLKLPATGHRGLARKVLPDVMGLFNSRFWRLWNPNA